MKLVNEQHRKRKKILKHSKTGLEAEFHLIDDKGRISYNSDAIINTIKDIKEGVFVVKEIGKSVIEFGSYPGVPAYNPSLDLIESVEKTIELCTSNGLMLFPFGSYPGRFKIKLRNDKKYLIQKKILGKERILITGGVAGFHHHYTLPKGVFDENLKILKTLKKSKIKRTLISSYNFEIAADPSLTLFTQSSPFYQGMYFAKDTRLIVYRGGRNLGYPNGVYGNLQMLGALPPYKQTLTDLKSSLKRRWVRWYKEIKKADPSIDFDNLYPFKLDITWNPVKINKHGTLEQRGMDINYLSIIVAVTTLLKYCLKKIQQEFIEVVPADFGIDEAFKLENGILYIPPHTYVREKLQNWSAYKGYDNKGVTEYAKRLYSFAKSVTPKRYHNIIQPVYDMIDEKKSISDRILQYAKYKGFLNGEKICNSDAAELALYYAQQLPNDLSQTKKKLEKISSL